jgi:hypothetical protein
MPVPLNDTADLPDFNPDFAGVTEWARMYRSLGLQVVPCGMNKAPSIKWKDYQNVLISDELFEEWYGPGGRWAGHSSLGILTGPCSGQVVVVDLDTQCPRKGGLASEWWTSVTLGLEPDTPCQRTGGGGLQYLFRVSEPIGTYKTSLGVDIRGWGGFAVMPPSRHTSGKNYQWLEHRAPWEVAIADMPREHAHV